MMDGKYYFGIRARDSWRPQVFMVLHEGAAPTEFIGNFEWWTGVRPRGMTWRSTKRLAVALLVDATGTKGAGRLALRFAHLVLCRLPANEWRLTAAEVRAWAFQNAVLMTSKEGVA